MTETTISVVCPYCNLRQPLDWEVGGCKSRLMRCGYRPITDKPYEGCHQEFVVRVAWEAMITVQALEGEHERLG